MGKIDKPDEAMLLAGEVRATIGLLKRRLRELSPPHSLTWSQISVLSRIEREGPVGISDLARREGVRPQSMGETVAGLQSVGLITGAPDPEDGRRTMWSLTPVCRDMIRAGRASRDDWLARTVRERLSAAEQKRLADAMVLLKRLGE
jgi:DNA-binding MarR family transcriptional regulator